MRSTLRMMMMAALMLLLPAAIQAQVFTPTFMSPRALNDLGGYLSDGPGDWALEGIWRGGPLGLRVGFVDGAADDLLSVGGELRSPLVLPDVPLGLLFTAGAQALVGDADAFGFQAGLSAGYTFTPEGVAITPYIHPRAALVNGFGPEDDLDFEVLADLGADVELANNVIIRLGINLSDELGSDWGIGVALRR